jgi:hypothetical protein
MNFSPELLYYIVRYIPLNEIVKISISLCSGISNSTLHSIILDRKNPKYIYKDLVPNTVELQDAMIKSGTALSGFRAFNYAIPIDLDDSIPWEFYCHNHPLSYLRFTKYLSSIGVKFIGKCSICPLLRENETTYMLSGNIDIAKDITRKVNIYWSTKKWSSSDPTNISTITDMGMSCHSCTIWGDIAFVPYAPDLFNKISYMWSLNTMPPTDPSMMTKYRYHREITQSRRAEIYNIYARNSLLFVTCKSKICIPPDHVDQNGKSCMMKFTGTNIIEPPSTDKYISEINEIEDVSYHIQDDESKVYSTIRQLMNKPKYQNVINANKAIAPYTYTYKPDYISPDAWLMTIDSIIKNDKLYIFI